MVGIIQRSRFYLLDFMFYILRSIIFELFDYLYKALVSWKTSSE